VEIRGWACGRLRLLVMLTALSAVSAEAQHVDRAGVERAALDHLEGSTGKIRRGVHPEVLKFGFYRESADEEYQRTPMSFDEMLQFATRVKESGRHPGPGAPKRVEILDVLDQTAVAKVHAWWGTDCLSVARYDGAWRIVQVLWQSPPMD